jgi:hypothetical protein
MLSQMGHASARIPPGADIMRVIDFDDPDAAIESARAIIQVGDARGFIVSAGEYDRYVITAAHCLPHYPEPHLANSSSELAYGNILGPLGEQERTVWAELVEFKCCQRLRRARRAR